MSDSFATTPPRATGDQTARRLARDVHRSCDTFEKEHKAASSEGTNTEIVTANNSRIGLEEDLATLQAVTDVSDYFMGRVSGALERGHTVLGNLPVLTVPEHGSNTAPIPLSGLVRLSLDQIPLRPPLPCYRAVTGRRLVPLVMFLSSTRILLHQVGV